MDYFCSYVHVCDAVLFLLFAALRSPAGKGLTSWLFCMLCFLVVLSFSHMMERSWSGVVLGCIDT